MKQGIKTSEFWITLASMVGTGAALVAGVVAAPAAVVAMAVSGAAYALGRGIAKAKAGDVEGAVTEVQNAVKAVRKR